MVGGTRPGDEPVSRSARHSGGGGPKKAKASATNRKALVIAGVVVGVLILAGAGVFAFFEARLSTSHDLTASGTALFEKGDFSGAGKDLSAAVQLAPDNSRAQALLGRSLEAKGDLAGAQAAYQASLKVDPSQPELLYRLAVISRATGEKLRAVDQLHAAIAQDKTYVAAHLLLARTLGELGDKAAARAEYDIVIKMKPLGVDIRALKKKRDALR